MTDASAIANLLAALAEIPGRLAALERQSAETMAALSAIKAALPSQLVTMAEAARLIKVSIPTVRRWVRSGELPSRRLGSTIRVDMSRLKGIDSSDVARLARIARRA